MKSDEKRSHRLNYLLKCYLINPQENELYRKAKQMGVTDSTAKDYIRTVIIQAQKSHSDWFCLFLNIFTVYVEIIRNLKQAIDK